LSSKSKKEGRKKRREGERERKREREKKRNKRPDMMVHHAFRRLRQEDLEFKASLDYTARPCL
jgi:hypothetical protein